MPIDAHAAPGADPRPSARGTAAAQRTAGRPSATATTLPAAVAPPPTNGKISVDPLHATDRYRLVMPWADRV